MNDFNPDTIIRLQNTLSLINIKRLLDQFVKENVREEEYPIFHDEERGILHFYDSYKDGVIEIKFENRLKDILGDISDTIKNDIDLSFTHFSSSKRVKFWDGILKSFEYIKEKSFEIIELFPVCMQFFEEIENYLRDKYSFSSLYQPVAVSLFTLKPKHSRKDLEGVYNFITGELYLDDEIYSFMDFYRSLMDLDSGMSLKFNCPTDIAVCILNELSELFADFTRKRVGESKRFFTKNNKSISEVNFNTTLSRIRRGTYKKEKKDIDKIISFFSKFSQN